MIEDNSYVIRKLKEAMGKEEKYTKRQEDANS